MANHSIARSPSHFRRIWKGMSLNNSLNDVERAELAVWDYPVSDKYTNMWQQMRNTTFPTTTHEALQWVMKGKFAFIGE